ncbi:DUF4145 domain-containing protein [Dactylosporangium sp. NPDC051541]|uniref:DUF4145 domain-containing protein n=1 Tax=Dactylosporangium sp. NPDC051541 TaxID=3363977 RepID=UPI0037BBCC9C
MTGHVQQLVNDSRNFRFLADPALAGVPEATLLAGDAATAEAYVHTDPDAAMARGRRFTETLAEDVARRAAVTLRPRAPQQQRTQSLFTAGAIPARVRDLLEIVRQYGNAAVHGYSGDRVKAMTVLQSCHELALWWYRERTGAAPGPAFVRPDPPAQLTRAMLRDIEEQIDRLRAAFEATPPPVARIRIGSTTPDGRRWRGGSEVVGATGTYLVHDPVETVRAEDGAWTLMQAAGRHLDGAGRSVWLRGLRVDDDGPVAGRVRDGLDAQAACLERPAAGLPALVERHRDGDLHLLVLDAPAGKSWLEMFGDGRPGLDPFMLPLALAVLADVADGLAALHRRGHAHRVLDGHSVRVVLPGRHGRLRDPGLVGWPHRPGEGGEHPAPEQRALARGRPGPPTDVFQLAALLHAGAGAGAGPGPVAVPLRDLLPTFPERLDQLLLRALDPDPGRRPGAGEIAAGLRQGRRELTAGVVA